MISNRTLTMLYIYNNLADTIEGMISRYEAEAIENIPLENLLNNLKAQRLAAGITLLLIYVKEYDIVNLSYADHCFFVRDSKRLFAETQNINETTEERNNIIIKEFQDRVDKLVIRLNRL